MGIKDFDGVLRYTDHGSLGCLWQGGIKDACSKNEIELCLKDAKESDDFARSEKGMSPDLD